MPHGSFWRVADIGTSGRIARQACTSAGSGALRLWPEPPAAGRGSLARSWLMIVSRRATCSSFSSPASKAAAAERRTARPPSDASLRTHPLSKTRRTRPTMRSGPRERARLRAPLTSTPHTDKPRSAAALIAKLARCKPQPASVSRLYCVIQGLRRALILFITLSSPPRLLRAGNRPSVQLCYTAAQQDATQPTARPGRDRLCNACALPAEAGALP